MGEGPVSNDTVHGKRGWNGHVRYYDRRGTLIGEERKIYSDVWFAYDVSGQKIGESRRGIHGGWDLYDAYGCLIQHSQHRWFADENVRGLCNNRK